MLDGEDVEVLRLLAAGQFRAQVGLAAGGRGGVRRAGLGHPRRLTHNRVGHHVPAHLRVLVEVLRELGQGLLEAHRIVGALDWKLGTPMTRLQVTPSRSVSSLMSVAWSLTTALPLPSMVIL